jgi:hypothetical protein
VEKIKQREAKARQKKNVRSLALSLVRPAVIKANAVKAKSAIDNKRPPIRGLFLNKIWWNRKPS